MRDVRLHVMEIVKTLFCASTTYEAAGVVVTQTKTFPSMIKTAPNMEFWANESDH